MSYQKMIIGVLLLLAMGFSAWSLLIDAHSPTAATTSSTTLDAFMEGVEAFVMDQQGKPSLKLVTPKMVHYTDNDTTDIFLPQLTLYRPAHQPWIITSQYAKATQGINQIFFWNNVIIHHPADYSTPTTIIKTPSLSVSPEKQTAWTQEIITVDQPNMTVRAKGMESDMISGTIKLLSQTSGEYVPGF